MIPVSKASIHRSPFEAIVVEGGIIPVEWLVKVSQSAAPFQTCADYSITTNLDITSEVTRFFRIGKKLWTHFANLESTDTAGLALAEAFTMSLLGKVFCFSDISPTKSKILDADTKYPIGHEALCGRVPIIVAPAGIGLDTRTPLFGHLDSRRSAFRLAQQYLNSVPPVTALWGIVTDGYNLRLVRKNDGIGADRWIDADIKRIFSEDRIADFATLWLLCHVSRFGQPGQKPHECILELWRSCAYEQKRRSCDLMRLGVRESLTILGDGFLQHERNGSLRDAIRRGRLSTEGYYNQLLRLVYRLIFLLTVEERNLLFPENSRPESRTTYHKGYSVGNIREDSTIRDACEDYCDRWDSIRVVFLSLSHEEVISGLPALKGIFRENACPDLDAAKISNRILLDAVFRISWIADGANLERANLRDISQEELGSVYESLLELMPQTRVSETGRLGFAFLSSKKGNARKTSGSYYTPGCLVKLLLESTLSPVIEETKVGNPGHHADALLSLTVVDPACGSGHFLLAAARELAMHLSDVELESVLADRDTRATEYRRAIRLVVGKCIFGVDLNPLAIELCKLNLWLEVVVPGLPLTFLDSHIQCGNSLFGTNSGLMRDGIPDVAWEPLVGDDKKTAVLLKKENLNRFWKHGQRELFPTAIIKADTVAEEADLSDLAGEGDIGAIMCNQIRWERTLDSPVYRKMKFVADLWCSAFVWPKQPGELSHIAPVNSRWASICTDETKTTKLIASTVEELLEQYGFFHWQLQFPHVFEGGGFDVVLSNPPWGRIKLEELEFFAARDQLVAGAPHAAARKILIASLPASNPEAWEQWRTACRKADGESHFIRRSSRFPLCCRGDVNTYSVFAEHNRDILCRRGRAGFIVPQGIVTDDSTKAFFHDITSNKQLVSFIGFENREGLFPDISRMCHFGACTLTKSPQQNNKTEFAFYAQNTSEAKESTRRFTLSPRNLTTLSPNTLTCPTFRSRRDAAISLAMYRRIGVLWLDRDTYNGNPWGIRFLRMFDMSNDSSSFRTRKELAAIKASLDGNRFIKDHSLWLPLVEAKMLSRFNHRHGSFEGRPTQKKQSAIVHINESDLSDPHRTTLPNFWVPEPLVTMRLSDQWDYEWLLGWRDVTSVAADRTLLACIIPRAAAANNFPIIIPSTEPALIACLYACLCSFPVDFAARQRVGGLHLNYFAVKQLPVPPPSYYLNTSPWQIGTLLRDWILPRVVELTHTAWDTQPFARDVGYDCPPFCWNQNRRFLLRCELDAAFFHVFGVSRDDTDYIMDSFSVIKKNDETKHGEYHTKQTILKIYDAMECAKQSRQPYTSLLFPPPANA